MKGVICAGGNGTRLAPATLAMNKHMIPILERPMILYPLLSLKEMGIKDILIVTGGGNVGQFADFLGSGEQWDLNISYRVQERAGGIAEAIGLAEGFASGEGISIILGDNIFENVPRKESFFEESAKIFTSAVNDPKRFGVPVFDKIGRLKKIEEKPKHPKSDYAIVGLYYFPHDVFDIIKKIKPSRRGELEVTDIINTYIKMKRCEVNKIKGFWKDAGTRSSLKEVIDWVYAKQ